MSDRREFLKQACTGCAAMMCFSFLTVELEGCKTADTSTIHFSNSQVTVPLKQMEGKNSLLIKSPSLEYDIVLIKKSTTEYLAFKMVCPHQNNPIVAYEKGFYCPTHGSEFDSDGNVTKGPAEQGLKKFPVTVGKKTALISLLA